MYHIITLQILSVDNKHCYYIDYSDIPWMPKHFETLLSQLLIQELQGNNKENTQAVHCWSFVREITGLTTGK